MLRLLAPLLLAAAIVAADAAPAWPALPDPIGLGPRLTTIVWLQDRGITMPAGASDEQILAWYAQESGQDAAQRDAAAVAQEHDAAYRQQMAERDAADRARSDQAVAAALQDAPATTTAPERPEAPARKPPPPSRKTALVARIENRGEWAANPDNAPVATRGLLSVTVYVKKDDTAAYYVLVDPQPGAVAADLQIDGIDYGTIKPGPTAALRKLRCLSGQVNAEPTVALRGLAK